MEYQYDLPTERSIQLADPEHIRGLPQNILSEANRHALSKLFAHLTFIEDEFARNMQWQRHLLAQISNSREEEERYRIANDCRLNADQQRQLRFVLGAVLGEAQQRLSIKEMIQLATKRISERNSQPPVYSFSPIKCQHEERLEFPNVPRVITLNDLAPSTQKQITASPASLPPRTPKAKARQVKSGDKQAKKLIFTPSQQQRGQSEGGSSQSQIHMRRSQNVLTPEMRLKQLVLEDSLGKRLFEQQNDKLIYIEEQFQSQLQESQVSLNLSHSNSIKKASVPQAHYLHPKNNSLGFSLESEGFEYQSIYLPVAEKASKCQQRINAAKQNDCLLGGLNFRQFPRRKIAKPSKTKAKPFVYVQKAGSQVRKMHDSFGEAYQEYYLAEGSCPENQASICMYHNNRYIIR